jgi:redox-sensing transcriptional repressor
MKNEPTKSKLLGVPEPSVRRMPAYLTLLKHMKEKGFIHISGPQIGEKLNIDSTQVVKDLSFAGASGKPKIGYVIEDLVYQLEDFLGYNKKHEAFLVGAGFLGSALMQYPGFTEAGMKIVAAFDTEKSKIGKEISGVMVFDIEKFRDLAERLHITIGIITTPSSVAQNVADLMVCWGIKAIWNFAPVSLRVPSHIIVQNTHMYSNLAVIINKLKENEQT